MSIDTINRVLNICLFENLLFDILHDINSKNLKYLSYSINFIFLDVLTKIMISILINTYQRSKK